MRKFKLTFLFAAIAVAANIFPAIAQLGTKTPYVPSAREYTVVPAGYAPVFIDYVGRHGARFLTKAGPEQELVRVLGEADRAGGLTDLGRDVLRAAGLLRDAGKGHYEQITILGGEEQAAIGERMRLGFPGVFKGRGLDVVTTYKLRTQQSADAFLHGFGEYSGGLRYLRKPDSLDTDLRFYDLSAGYTRYKKGALIGRCMDSLAGDERSGEVTRSVCGRIFAGGYGDSLAGGAGSRVVDALYDCFAISWSMKGELRDSTVQGALGRAFRVRDLEWLAMKDGAADFLEKGAGFDSLGIQVRVAVPLLVDFIRTVDRAVRGEGSDAVLRFTHAEAISPFAALMGIGGASRPVRSILGYRERWRAEAVIPLSANIQWIVYRKAGGGGDVLVKVLLNEKEVSLPIRAYRGPYYRWADLRAFYLRKLGRLGVSLDTDMLRYLAELRDDR